MFEEKNVFDIIYLNDNEIGIESDHEKSRPCLIIKICDNGNGYILPLTSNGPKYEDQNKYQLSCGSFIDLDDIPILIKKRLIDYSDIANDLYVTDYDINEIEYHYSNFM